jgi:hypothetical protein
LWFGVGEAAAVIAIATGQLYYLKALFKQV